ncbi:MAG: hypothetical protein PUA63_08840 [Oscillospiraceae bacterium]|nr:hypothetical protein [Oscillospiraceae bacterium]
MKQNKWTVIILFPFTVCALFLAQFFDLQGYPFESNVFLGVFGSGLLTVMVALINYATERRRTLETFWVIGHKAIRAFNKYPIDGSFDDKIESILLINEFDFDAFGDAYTAIDFLFCNKRLKKRIFNEIYCPIRDASYTISNSASNIVRLRRSVPGNAELLEPYVTKVDQELIKTETFESKLRGKYVYNRITRMCNDRFEGFYRKIMYPLKKQEEQENAD